MFETHTMTPLKNSASRLRWFPRFLLVLGIYCLALYGSLESTPMTFADSIPGGNVSDPVVRAVDIAEPAVVRILTTLGGHLTVHFSARQAVTFPQNDPKGYPLELSGTGAFVSAHGDILTADHVVNPPHDSQLDQFLYSTAAKDVATFYNTNDNPGPAVTTDQVTQGLTSGQLLSSTQYDTPSSEIFLTTNYTGPLNAQNISSVPTTIHATVDKIEQQSSFNDKDVAIVHVSNMDDMPSISLGDSTGVHQQDELTIIGFPGNGDVNTTNPTDFLTPSVNKVFVSSTKTSTTGAPLIQVAGNVEHGDSGGPALDTNGNSVGVVSFGTNSPGNTSFLQASSSAEGLIKGLNLDTTPGKFEKAWSLAFTDYAATTPGHWHKAQQEFEQIAHNYSLFQAVTPYLAYAQAQAKNERLPQTRPNPVSSITTTSTTYRWILVGVGAAIFILVLLLLLIFGATLRRRQKKKTAASPMVVQVGDPWVPTPTVPSQGMYSSQQSNGMGAFGAPPPASMPVQGAGQTSQGQFPGMPASVSTTLRPWPCGHMNRPNARYCSICGEPAPPEPMVRRYEQ